MQVHKTSLKILSIVLLILLSSCDFKPKGYQIYTGKEPVLNLNVSGIRGKILHFDVLNIGSQFGKSSNTDTLHSKEYLNLPICSLLRLYVAPDSLGYSTLEYIEKPIFKVVDFYGNLEITGDVSNGLTLKNIVQNEEDRTTAKFFRKLDEYNLKIENASGKNFEYGKYLKTYDSIYTYLDANLTIEKTRYLPLLITYLEIAAHKVPVSKTFLAQRFNYSFEHDSDLKHRLSDFYYYSFLKLPPFSIHEKLTPNELSKDLNKNVFFKAPYPKKLRVLITDAFHNDQSKLEELKDELRERFHSDLDILTVPYDENIKQDGNFETVFHQEKRAKYFLKTQPLTTTIIDENNIVLLNTVADENLELKVEGILDYLKNNNVEQLD
ncbi:MULTISPECIES: hypothetical protein [unclassified Leeuwenhoekiella]|uniref:hypothetical protein n=1 Tax=unclassified Leeuwenhoekiella TaxID=2615029 RepID=UPI000C3BE49F|nr:MULTISPECIES: hypothetical protein [unclassified Leeuwenhoekiella]MAW94433.1 hypothetical protein [Leeuwenhoekiella sp.]MBA81110.1 hypothetical protein [Leeuwenhoekiella sp.]|tara:strand:+ start:272 stop:1411 length:1140 start_codon:yes stop_codon:yes gene_type:complete